MISRFSSLGLHDSKVDSLLWIIKWNLQNMISIHCTPADESFLQAPVNTPVCTARQKRVASFHPCFPITGIEQQGCTKVGDSAVWISHPCQVDLLVREEICALTMVIKRKAITPCSYRSTSIFLGKSRMLFPVSAPNFRVEFSAAWLKFCALSCMVYPLYDTSKLHG